MVFGLAALLFVLAFAVADGTARGVLAAAAMFVFFGACIRGIGRAVRDNPVSAQMLARRDVVHGSLVREAAEKHRHTKP